jgi:hypothetical protein
MLSQTVILSEFLLVGFILMIETDEKNKRLTNLDIFEAFLISIKLGILFLNLAEAIGTIYAILVIFGLSSITLVVFSFNEFRCCNSCIMEIHERISKKEHQILRTIGLMFSIYYNH